MRIKIIFEFKEVSGGGNQFLKALKKFFFDKGVYEDDTEKADVILFNSHHDIKRVLLLKRRFPDKIFIHRVDGLISLSRSRDDGVDRLIFKTNKLLADGTIFQSDWSKMVLRNAGLSLSELATTITNAPDQRIFNNISKKKFSRKRKFKIIANSWSDNWNKGFADYKWLDENLDFEKHEMTFVGNLPEGLNFDNINHIKSLKSASLADELRRNDVFITASKNDTCSNSLIEALHCGLPAIGLNNGGNPEIIKRGGEVYSNISDIPAIVNLIENNYAKYQNSIDVDSMKEVGGAYLDFIKEVFRHNKKRNNCAKKIRAMGMLEIRMLIFFQKVRKCF